MIEAGVVIDIHGEPIHWHLPPGRTGGSLPDSRDLWDVLWKAHTQGILGGFAHSHPGEGIPHPSYTDYTTFLAVQRGLGRDDIIWWITSSDYVIAYTIERNNPSNATKTLLAVEPVWVPELRRLSIKEI